MTKKCPFKIKEKRYKDKIIGYEDSPTGDIRHPIRESYEIDACSLRRTEYSYLECVGEDKCPILNKCSDCPRNTANNTEKELDIVDLCAVCGGYISSNKKYHTCVCNKKKVN